MNEKRNEFVNDFSSSESEVSFLDISKSSNSQLKAFLMYEEFFFIIQPISISYDFFFFYIFREKFNKILNDVNTTKIFNKSYNKNNKIDTRANLIEFLGLNKSNNTKHAKCTNCSCQTLSTDSTNVRCLCCGSVLKHIQSSVRPVLLHEISRNISKRLFYSFKQSFNLLTDEEKVSLYISIYLYLSLYISVLSVSLYIRLFYFSPKTHNPFYFLYIRMRPFNKQLPLVKKVLLLIDFNQISNSIELILRHLRFRTNLFPHFAETFPLLQILQIYNKIQISKILLHLLISIDNCRKPQSKFA